MANKKCISEFSPNYPNTTEDREWMQIIMISSNQWLFQENTEMASRLELFHKVKKRSVFLVCPNLSSKREEKYSSIWTAQLGLESSGVRCCDCWRKLFSSCFLKGFKAIPEHGMASGEDQASCTKDCILWYFTTLYYQRLGYSAGSTGPKPGLFVC